VWKYDLVLLNSLVGEAHAHITILSWVTGRFLLPIRVFRTCCRLHCVWLMITCNFQRLLKAHLSDYSTDADGSRVSIAIIRLCDSVILSVCPHDKTKTAKTKIAKLGREIVHHDISPTNEY